MSRIVLGALLAAGISLPASAQVKIGFLNTFSGPSGILGQEMLDGFKLAMTEEGGKLGGVPVELIVGDDQQKPDLGRQLADKMVERDRVDLMVGVAFSNVMQAIARPVLDSGTILISPNAGLAEQAGKACDPNFFAVRDQNDENHEAMGQYANANGYKRVYLLAPNYPAGKEALAGFKRFFKGEVVAEVYTPLNQLDFAAELAQLRAAKPQAVYFFYPGGLAVNFLKQYAQAGLTAEIPILGPSYSLDQTVLPAVGDAAIGALASAFWSERMDNPANKKFVAGFEEAHNRIPSPYAMQGYDTARLIASALKATGGKVKDKAAMREALRKADFTSVRGRFRFNRNNFPIQDYYVGQIVRDEKGRAVLELRGTVFAQHRDAYVDECKMKQPS